VAAQPATQTSDHFDAFRQGWVRLDTLYLNNTRVTDAGLEHLKELVDLRVLELDNTQVTDAGMKCLQPLCRLEIVSLRGTQVTDFGEAELTRAFPNKRIDR